MKPRPLWLDRPTVPSGARLDRSVMCADGRRAMRIFRAAATLQRTRNKITATPPDSPIQAGFFGGDRGRIFQKCPCPIAFSAAGVTDRVHSSANDNEGGVKALLMRYRTVCLPAGFRGADRGDRQAQPGAACVVADPGQRLSRHRALSARTRASPPSHPCLRIRTSNRT